MYYYLWRYLDESLANNLRIHAQQHGQTVEEEARQILHLAFSQPAQKTGGLGSKISKRFRELTVLNCRYLFARYRVSQ